MLILNRRPHPDADTLLMFGNGGHHLATVQLLGATEFGRVKLGIVAPNEVSVLRGELTVTPHAHATYHCQHCGHKRLVAAANGAILEPCPACGIFAWLKG